MSFLRNLLANLVSLVVFSLFVVVVLVAVTTALSETPVLEKHPILHLELSGRIIDKVDSDEFDFSKGGDCGKGYLAINQSVQAAIKNKDVLAIYLEVGEVSGGIANLSSLRRSIRDFQATGRKVYAYTDGVSQMGYYLASVADSVFVHPMAHVEWKGLSAQLMYFKSMLNKIGIQAEPIRAGKFKSAIEPFILDEMSEANEEQVKELLTDIWGVMIDEVCSARSIESKKLTQLTNELGYFLPDEAASCKLIDGIKYEDEMAAFLKNAVQDHYNLVSVKAFNNVQIESEKSNQKVVVIHAEGEINDGKEYSNISSGYYCKLIDEVLLDEEVKAVVLRINSPGGSAMASEKIWRKVKLLSEKMPVIVSMGNVSASGGYYIAAAGDSIFAEEATITGSIGVFGLMFNMKELSSNIGVNVEKVKTNELSDFPSFDRPLSVKEKERLSEGIQSVYSIFLQRVSEGRGLTIEEVEALAAGRVWTGRKAKELGLVDEVGGLQEALLMAIKCAGLEEYQVVKLPKELSTIEKIAQHFGDAEVSLPAPFTQYNYMIQNPQFFKDFSKPQVRLPFVLSFE